MKRLLIIVAIFVVIIGTVCAQQWGNNRGWSQSITVSGILQLQNGTIAVVDENNVYYVPALERYIGFIEGLKEGAQVSMEGYFAGNGNYVQPLKVIINGKSYDFAANAPRSMRNNSYGRTNVQYGGCCGAWGW